MSTTLVLLKNALETTVNNLISDLSILSGWDESFLEILKKPEITKRRGYYWAMYGYSVLGQREG
jgi:hypothetical protein